MNPLKQKLDINNERYRIIVSVKEDYLDGKLSLEEGNRILKEKLGTCTPDEFAYAEQSLKGVYKDEEILDKMDDLLNLFDGVLVRAQNEYPENHPLWVYLEEINAVEKVALEADELLKQEKFIKNPWLGIFDSLAQWRTHLSRKQNQLYPMLEEHGFDRPTRIMWTFDDGVRDAISASYALLREDKYEEFLASVPETLAKLRDLNSKELEVLLPTSFKLLSDEEFVRMSKNDHEIGYAIIDPPGLYVVPGINDSAAQLNVNNSGQNGVSNEFLNDLAGLLSKYVGPVGGAPVGKDAVLDVATGKLTLEQINLLFRHLPVDLSYVDENELVKFYSDTPHRIFPRSANVIGREVKNCHPAKSVHVVEEIVEKFRSGEQSQAEFWINKPGLFIYVIYTAVRDENGKFRGVLEMMQDCTHIRELEGSLTKIIAFSKISNQTIDLDFAKDVLKDYISPEEDNTITCKKIIEVVADHFGISPNDLASKKRSKEIAYARQVCMYICKTLTDETNKKIGLALHKDNPSTVIYGVNQIKEEMARDINTKNMVEVIIKKLNTK